MHWTSPPIEVEIDGVPGFDWNQALTRTTQELIEELLANAELEDFTFDVGNDQELAPISQEAVTTESDACAQSSASEPMPCYFADLTGTARWTNNGLFVSIWFRPGQDWRELLL